MVAMLVLLGKFCAMLLARDEKSSVGCTSSLNWPSRPRNRSIIVRGRLEELDSGVFKTMGSVEVLKCRVVSVFVVWVMSWNLCHEVKGSSEANVIRSTRSSR